MGKKKILSMLLAAAMTLSAAPAMTVQTSADMDVNVSSDREVEATEMNTTQVQGAPAPQSGDIYASPNGKGSGTSASDPTSVANALKNVKAGHTVWLAAGTYTFSSSLKIEKSNSGTASASKNVYPLNGGTVVFDFSAQKVGNSNRGIILEADYWHFYGFEITKAGDNGMLLAGNHNVIERMIFNDNQDTGLQVSANGSNSSTRPSYNMIKNCTSKNNCDEATMENADGFAAKLTCGDGNVFDGCISHNNSDDGWDLFAKTDSGPIGVVTIRKCVAFRNGRTEYGEGTQSCDGNGFKLGGSGVGSAHVVENCLAFENLHCGFTDNNNPKLERMSNCTAYNNGLDAKPNFSVYRCTDDGCDFSNTISFYDDGLSERKKAAASVGLTGSKIENDKYVGTFRKGIYYNSGYLAITEKIAATNGMKKGNAVQLSNSDFISVKAPAKGTDFDKAWRNADGSVNVHGFMQVKPQSAFAGYEGAQLGTDSAQPTTAPTKTPTNVPTKAPTQKPTTAPTKAPTKAPTAAPTTKPANGDVYVSPNGRGSGTSAYDPMAIADAVEAVTPGHTIWLLEGTYRFDSSLVISNTNNGTPSAPKTIRNYDGGRVVFDFSGESYDPSSRGVVLDGDYWHFYGFEITKAGDNGMLLSGNNNVIERMVFNDNRDTGLQLSRYDTNAETMADWPANNLVLNCTSLNNCDEKSMENADGFAAKLTCGEGNVFYGCIAHNNSDDGWDLYAKPATGPIGAVKIQNCVAYRNGRTEDGRGGDSCDGNGFKLGGSGVGSPHTVDNCLAFENIHCGFTDNNNPKLESLSNCTAYNNGLDKKPNFSLYRCTDDGCDFKNIISYYDENFTLRQAAAKAVGLDGTSTDNDKFVGTFENGVYLQEKWLAIKDKVKAENSMKLGTQINPTNSDFVSLASPANGVDIDQIWRNEDGSLNLHGFMQVKANGQLASYKGAQLSNDSVQPTVKPTRVPTAAPTAKPTAKPTKAPTATPTPKPTKAPTATPTAKPTAKPTKTPTATPKPTTAPRTRKAYRDLDIDGMISSGGKLKTGYASIFTLV